VRISIIGTGYVGLVTGACLADRGHSVTCVDVDPTRVADLNAARSPIYEAGLDELLARNVGRNLRATGDLAAAVLNSDVTFIAVGTPFIGDAIDLTAVLGAARQIGAALHHKSDYHLVVVKSTVVPGTTDSCVVPALEAASGKRAGQEFGVGMNPEFLSEGEAVNDFMFPDRIVLGGIDERSIHTLEQVYAPFPDAPRLPTNTRTAEMIKYASNALLANLISFCNEVANLGSAIGGIDATEVMRGVHLSQYFRPRSGEELPAITSFLKPGCGFGGSCLPKDVKALIAHARTKQYDMRVLEAVIRVNEGQPGRVVDLLGKHWDKLRDLRVTVLGLSFKPGTSDVRESPAFPIVKELVDRGADVRVYDPVVKADEVRHALPAAGVAFCNNVPSAVENADAVIVVTPWEEFQTVPALVRAQMPEPVLIDCRRAFPKDSVSRYEGVGL
jgi:UDPglucose 6-dehydrogenase